MGFMGYSRCKRCGEIFEKPFFVWLKLTGIKRLEMCPHCGKRAWYPYRSVEPPEDMTEMPGEISEDVTGSEEDLLAKRIEDSKYE